LSDKKLQILLKRYGCEFPAYVVRMMMLGNIAHLSLQRSTSEINKRLFNNKEIIFNSEKDAHDLYAGLTNLWNKMVDYQFNGVRMHPCKVGDNNILLKLRLEIRRKEVQAFLGEYLSDIDESLISKKAQEGIDTLNNMIEKIGKYLELLNNKKAKQIDGLNQFMNDVKYTIPFCLDDIIHESLDSRKTAIDFMQMPTKDSIH